MERALAGKGIGMKILHIINDMNRNGGAQKVVMDLVSRKPQDHAIQVLTLYDDNDYKEDLRALGIESFSLKEMGIGDFMALRKWPDLVHAHLFPSVYLALMFPCLKVQTEHNSHNRRRDYFFLKPFELFMYNRFNLHVSISQEVMKRLKEYLGAKNVSKFPVIYNGIDLLRFKPAQEKRALLSSGSFKVGMVGRLHFYKDQKTIIKAASHFKDPIEVHFAGGGDRHEELQSYAESLGIGGSVYFHGVIEDIPGFLMDLDCYIQSSVVEGFGLAAVEAMAVGLPVLATDVPGLNEVIASDDYVFPLGDDKLLFEKVYALKNSKDQYETAVSHSLKRAALFSADEFSDSYYKTYHKLSERLS